MKIGNYDIANSTLKCGLVFGTAVAGLALWMAIRHTDELEDYIISKTKEKIVYKEMSPRQKWQSLKVDDKVYFLKTGYNDLPNSKKEEVCDFLKDDFLENSNDLTSKIHKYKKYFDSRMDKEEILISKRDQERNYKNLEKFLGGY